MDIRALFANHLGNPVSAVPEFTNCLNRVNGKKCIDRNIKPCLYCEGLQGLQLIRTIGGKHAN